MTASPPPAALSERHFGTLPDGTPVREYTLDNGRGLRLSALGLGGVVTRLEVPDRDGRPANVVLALPTVADYLTRSPYFGALVGPVANRIAGGRFAIDGHVYETERNDGSNTLHSGKATFSRRAWQVTPEPGAQPALLLALTHEAGDGGFPGRLQVQVRYALTPDNAWHIDYRATTDAPAVLNLTQHSYFNLSGGGSVLDHELTLAASRYLPVDEGLIPLQPAAVEGTPFDFRQPTPVGARIRQPHPQLVRAKGYDHCWILDGERSAEPTFAARVHEPRSGRVLEVLTTEPALQCYSGNFLDGTLPALNGQLARQGDALCLETEHYPDAPNRPDFPSVLLRPGETFRSRTIYRFGVAR